MAITAIKNLAKRSIEKLSAFPVASGEAIYQGALAVIKNDGYLYNLTSTIAVAGDVQFIGWVADGSENNNATTPTSNGSISGDSQEASGLSNDEKTVRKLCTMGEIYVDSASGLAQDDLGKTLYATDNDTFSLSAVGGIAVGRISKYISATECWVELNSFEQKDGSYVHKIAVTAATTTAGGDAISWKNPTGQNIIVEDVILDITTPATGAATMDVGVAANGTTSSDTIYDGIDVGTAAILASASTGNGGTNGKLVRKMSSTQYITGTPSATLAGLVGTVSVKYRIWN